jgi:putative endonuclease
MYYVYILRSTVDGTFYTGMSTDVAKRLKEHNSGKSRYTNSKSPWIVIYSEQLKTRIEAREREKYWKSGAGREERSTMLRVT